MSSRLDRVREMYETKRELQERKATAMVHIRRWKNELEEADGQLEQIQSEIEKEI